MSLRAMTWALENSDCPSPAAKLVLWVFSNYVDVRGYAWPSSTTIARLTKLDIKTVRSAIDAMEGILIEDTGVRTGRTGQVKVYKLLMESHPETDSFDADVLRDAPQIASKGGRERVASRHPKTDSLKAPVFPAKGTQKREAEPVTGTNTPKDPDGSLSPQGEKSDRRSRISEDWAPCPISELPPRALTIAASWPAGAYEAEAEGHRAFCIGAGATNRDWDQVWISRIVSIGAKPLRDAKAGLKHAAPIAAKPAAVSTAASTPLSFVKIDESELMAQWRNAVAATIGFPNYSRWIDSARLELDDEMLTIVVGSPMIEQQIGASYLFRLEPVTERILQRRLTRLQVRRQAA